MKRISKIFLTHLHGDHVFGLPGLMCTMSQAKGGDDIEAEVEKTNEKDNEKDNEQEKEKESISQDQKPSLEIIGPPGTREYIRMSLLLSQSQLSYLYTVTELHSSIVEKKDVPLHPSERPGLDLIGENSIWNWETEEGGGLKLFATSIAHTVSCLGFVINTLEQPGKLTPETILPHLERNAAELKKQGVSNVKSLLSKVKAGETLSLPDGTIIRPEDHIGVPKKGKKVVILGDTSDPSKIVPLAMDCDLVIHESTLAKLSNETSKTFEDVEKLAKERGHSTPQMAGQFAKLLNSKTLILTHFSQRYKGDGSEESLKVIKEIIELAKTEFQGEIVAASDLMSFQIK